MNKLQWKLKSRKVRLSR